METVGNDEKQFRNSTQQMVMEVFSVTGYNLKINEDELNSLNSHSIDEWIRNWELRRKELDDCYRGEKDGYEYRDVQLSSSHVHAMLATAIAKTMDWSEVLIFLNTNNSCPKVEESVSSDWLLLLQSWLSYILLCTISLKTFTRTHFI